MNVVTGDLFVVLWLYLRDDGWITRGSSPEPDPKLFVRQNECGRVKPCNCWLTHLQCPTSHYVDVTRRFGWYLGAFQVRDTSPLLRCALPSGVCLILATTRVVMFACCVCASTSMRVEDRDKQFSPPAILHHKVTHTTRVRRTQQHDRQVNREVLQKVN